MSDLFTRFSEDLQLRGMSNTTIDMYLRAVRQLTNFYQKSPELISDEELRQYFLYNKNGRKWSRVASTISLCGIKHFYTLTLKREWTSLKFVRPEKEKKLPVILSQQEVKAILNRVYFPHHRACLKVIYSLGLRIGEGTNLQVSDIDSDCMFVHIHRGKGNKDRYIPLPERILEILRAFYKMHRNPVWIFPAPGRGAHNLMPIADYPIPISSIQIAFKEAKIKAGVHKKVSVRHLRHSYATHLLEAGVSLRYVQQYLGHDDPKTWFGRLTNQRWSILSLSNKIWLNRLVFSTGSCKICEHSSGNSPPIRNRISQQICRINIAFLSKGNATYRILQNPCNGRSEIPLQIL